MTVQFFKVILVSVLSLAVALTTGIGLQAAQDQNAPPPSQDQGDAPPQSAHLTPQQLQELVAPIALYPDALVAQILAASAYPTQIVEAERFVEENPNLKGTALGTEVDKQDWDPSVKALTEFPSVLSDMNKNLAWTSELGDANVNQGADVMAAVQYMRTQAQKAGTLKTTPQQTVTDQGSTVVIQPADPNVVYVPEYDPELVYGYPVGLWPGFYPWWGIGGPYIGFGIGFGIGPFFGFGWGWGGWGFDWYGGGIRYGGGRYDYHSHAFYDRNAYFHGNYRGYSGGERGDRGARGFGDNGGRGGDRGGEARGGGDRGGEARGGGDRGWSGSRSGGFGDVSRGGDARGWSSRGQSSFGGGGFGGGGFHGGGGGGHGGGHR